MKKTGKIAVTSFLILGFGVLAYMMLKKKNAGLIDSPKSNNIPQGDGTSELYENSHVSTQTGTGIDLGDSDTFMHGDVNEQTGGSRGTTGSGFVAPIILTLKSHQSFCQSNPCDTKCKKGGEYRTAWDNYHNSHSIQHMNEMGLKGWNFFPVCGSTYGTGR